MDSSLVIKIGDVYRNYQIACQAYMYNHTLFVLIRRNTCTDASGALWYTWDVVSLDNGKLLKLSEYDIKHFYHKMI